MDNYYKLKAKDSQEQTIIVIWLVIIAVCFGTWYCTFKWVTHKCPEPQQARIMSIIELQEVIGAEPDGIIGPDTIAKWDMAYANQEAAKFMTPSGKPR